MEKVDEAREYVAARPFDWFGGGAGSGGGGVPCFNELSDLQPMLI